jgi:ABC-type ATPase involved in cell division
MLLAHMQYIIIAMHYCTLQGDTRTCTGHLTTVYARCTVLFACSEKRRLSIAVEMVTRPAVLFLDECTTGLDSASALAVMRMVAGIAARGTAVVCRYADCL